MKSLSLDETRVRAAVATLVKNNHLVPVPPTCKRGTEERFRLADEHMKGQEQALATVMAAQQWGALPDVEQALLGGAVSAGGARRHQMLQLDEVLAGIGALPRDDLDYL